MQKFPPTFLFVSFLRGHFHADFILELKVIIPFNGNLRSLLIDVFINSLFFFKVGTKSEKSQHVAGTWGGNRVGLPFCSPHPPHRGCRKREQKQWRQEES